MIIRGRINFKKICLSTGFFCIAVISNDTARAQAVVDVSGNTLNNGQISLEYSVGEISINTLSRGNDHTTQGLLQPIIKFKDCNMLRFIPNAFSPNNDRLNDCFGVANWPGASSFELNVFNRWGELVFKSDNSLKCWDGEYKGTAQPAGVYIYMIKATTDCGQISYKGTVLLIR